MEELGNLKKEVEVETNLNSSFKSHLTHYPPPLASTIASREWAFEADSDTISVRNNNSPPPPPPSLLLPLTTTPLININTIQTKKINLNQGKNINEINENENDLFPLKEMNIESRSINYNNENENEMYQDDISTEEEELLLLSRRRRNEIKENEINIEEYGNLIDVGSGMMAGVANMANSILGAGIISIPYALKNSGFFTGTLMVILIGFLTDWSINLIALNSKLTGKKNYIGILEICFGFFGKFLVSFFQFIFAFGGMCAFGVIVGDTIPPVLSTLFPFINKSNWFSFLFSRSFVIIFFTITVSYPLSLYRDISKLSKASTLALLSMVIIVFSVAIGGPSVDSKLKGDPKARWTFIEPGIVEAIGVISFAFVCHHNSLLIYGSLRTPTLDRFAQVTHLSTAISVIACLVMSFSGFLSFTDRTEANILNNFPRDDLVINIARVCFGLNMFTTLPLECFVCRETIETFFYPDEVFNKTRHFISTTLLVGIGMLLSLWTCDLGVVLELTGGFAASALAFVFPAACHLRLCIKSNSEIFKREHWSGILTVSFGLAVMIISTTHSLFKALDPNRIPKVCH